MKKTRGHYPYNVVLRISGQKIIGKAEKKEKQYIMDLLFEDLVKANSEISRKEFDKKVQKLDLYFTRRLPVFYGAAGVSILNKVFVEAEMLDYIEVKQSDEIRNSYEYLTLFHETIHFLQPKNIKNRVYQGHNIIGFIEGVTEKESVETLDSKRSTYSDGVSFNFQTSASNYVDCVLIMQQLEVLYGRELVKDFCFKLDRKLLDVISEDLGKDFLYEMLNYTNNCAKLKEEKNKFDFIYLQDELMQLFFNKRINNCNTVLEADNLIKKLKEYGLKRKFDENNENNNFYEKYYNEVVLLLSKKIPQLNIDDYHYESPKFYPYKIDSDRIDHLYYIADMEIEEIVRNYCFDENNKKENNSETIINKVENLIKNGIEYYYYFDDYMAYGIIINKTDNSCYLDIDVSNECFRTYGTYDSEKNIYTFSESLYKELVDNFVYIPTNNELHFKKNGELNKVILTKDDSFITKKFIYEKLKLVLQEKSMPVSKSNTLAVYEYANNNESLEESIRR